MLMKFIYTFLFAFLIFTFGFFLTLLLVVFLLKFILNNLSNIDGLLTKEAWSLFFQFLWKEIPLSFAYSILMGVMLGAATVIVYLCDRSIVPNLRTRFIGIGILAVFMASLFFLAKYYGLIPLKNAFA